MEVARDLIRDLVGILFPGGLLVTLTLLAFWAVTAPFSPLASSSISPTDKSIIILLILSYVAGQSLGIKQLKDIEERCTEEYRKKHFLKVTLLEWEEFVKDMEVISKFKKALKHSVQVVLDEKDSDECAICFLTDFEKAIQTTKAIDPGE